MDLSKHLEKAEEAVKRRNYAFAVNLYGQLLALQPDNGEARAGLRRALFRKAEQKKPSRVFALIGSGFNLIVAGACRMFKAHAAAAKAYERYLRADPLHEGVNLKLAAALESAGFERSALAVYQAWAQQEPRSLVAAREAGRLLYEAGRNDEALAMYEQALKIDPRDQDSVRARKNLAAEGALARSGLETATSSRDLIRDKTGQRRLEQAARLTLTPEEIASEIEEVEARLAERPDDLKALRRLAELHEMGRDRQAALDCLERALQLAPDDSDLETRVGDLRIALQEERVADAERRGDRATAARARSVLHEIRAAEYRRRIARNPTDPGLRHQLGKVLFESGEHDAAITELQQAVRDPRVMAEALFLLGRAFRAKGHSELAKTQLEKALTAAGSANGALGKEILYTLGEVLEELGRTDEAIASFSRILEQDYGFRDAADRVERLRSVS